MLAQDFGRLSTFDNTRLTPKPGHAVKFSNEDLEFELKPCINEEQFSPEIANIHINSHKKDKLKPLNELKAKNEEVIRQFSQENSRVNS